MPPEVVVDTVERLPELLTQRFEEEARIAVSRRGRFAVALPGGSVATHFFPRLARAGVDWRAVHFFWGDERAVPPSDFDSNFRLARTLWLESAGVPPDCIHRVEADVLPLAEAADAYAETLAQVLGEAPALDLALLGVGPDGHVCSLFPGHPLLREERRRVAAIEDAPKPPPRRVTLTLPTLAAARLVVIVALGEGKARVIREAVRDPDSPLPVALAARRARRCVFFLDTGAASLSIDRDPQRPHGR